MRAEFKGTRPRLAGPVARRSPLPPALFGGVGERHAGQPHPSIGHAKMLSRLPAGISPARREAAVPADWKFTAVLCGMLSVELV